MLNVENLTKTFGRTRALSGVNLRVGPGEMVALIGASGSGKSTILRHCSGLVASDPGQGAVTVAGRVIQSGGRLSRDIRRLRSSIGVVFQQFNLVGRLTVSTNVLLGALGRTPLWRSAFRSFSRGDRALAMEALEKVGIAETAGRRASTLSGGQQQRAAIARALVQRSSLILADEPIASLDPESSIKVMELLRRLNVEDGLTVVVSLHQIDYALKYCPRVVALRGGSVLYDGPAAGLSPEAIGAIYGERAASMFSDGAESPLPRLARASEASSAAALAAAARGPAAAALARPLPPATLAKGPGPAAAPARLDA
jgi:phosphonate transport system ATP-binding protein